MEITCRAKTTLWHPGFRHIYSCNIVKSDLITKEGEKIKFKLTHEENGKSNDDVQAIVFLDSKMVKIPRNFQSIFKNLSILCIKQCKLTKIVRKDLQNLRNLKEIWMPNNLLKELPGDLFVDHPKIEKLSFSNNKISVVGARLLDPIENLKFANFNKNLTIDVTFDIDEDIIDLEELKRVIKVNCCGLKRPTYKPGKRNFTYMRNSTDSNVNFSKFVSNSTKTVSSIQNISCATSSSINIVRLRHIFSSGSVNTEQSFQRVQYVDRRRQQAAAKPKYNNQGIQTDQKTFTDDINKFLFCENFKDFAIRNEQKTFNVHKFVMAARSPAVRTMIINNPTMKGIELLNANDDIIQLLLNFIYEDQMPEVDEFHDFLKIFDLSVKLELKELTEFSREKILKKVNSQNAIDCLEVAVKHDDKSLKITGMEVIQKMFPHKKFKATLQDDHEALKKMIDELKIMKIKIDQATLQFNQMSFFD